MVGLSQDGDKNEEFVFVSGRLTMGRESYQEASAWQTTPQRHCRCFDTLSEGEMESIVEEVQC